MTKTLKKHILAILIYGTPMLFVFTLSTIFELYTDWYTEFSNLDNIMHFTGGLVTAHLAWNYLCFLEKGNHLNIKSIYAKLVLTFGVMLIVALIWEWYELLRDIIQGTEWQTDGHDILLDFFMDSLGTIVYLGINTKFDEKKYNLEE